MSLDLTKRRYSLTAKGKGIIKDNSAVMFAFVDINCSLALKLNDRLENFILCPVIVNSITLIAKMNLIRFYRNVSLCLLTTIFIPYDLCLVVVAIWL